MVFIALLTRYLGIMENTKGAGMGGLRGLKVDFI